jgi:TolA-binding protein
MDVGPARDAVTVRLASRHRPEDAPGQTEEFDVELAAAGEADEQEQWVVRDQLELNLEELGEGEAIRTGEFGGRVQVGVASGDEADKTDDTLVAKRGDQIFVSFIDERHIEGETPREASNTIEVVGEIDARPRATQNVVTDPVLKAKKNIVEATAFLELARIFKSMGLLEGAADKADEGLERVDEIITPGDVSIPDNELQQAFKLRWELFLVQDDYSQAIATCRLFNRLYPDSPFVDQALLGIAEVRLEQGNYAGARNIYRQVLRLANSQAKAEALFQTARTLQIEAEEKEEAEARLEGREPENVISEQAIKTHRECARKYPDSEFAGKSLGKVIDYYVKNKDYIRADDLLSQVFQDYPDAQFLDSMLLKWVVVAFRMGNFQKAYDKCSDLLFQYPESDHAETAKQLLPKIQKRLNS